MEQLVDDGDITNSIWKTICVMLNVHKYIDKASLIRRLIVLFRGMLLKRRVKTTINSASSLSVTDNLLELVKINKMVHYNVVKRLGQEATNDNKLEVGMICDGYLMRIDNLTPNNFF